MLAVLLCVAPVDIGGVPFDTKLVRYLFPIGVLAARVSGVPALLLIVFTFGALLAWTKWVTPARNLLLLGSILLVVAVASGFFSKWDSIAQVNSFNGWLIYGGCRLLGLSASWDGQYVHASMSGFTAAVLPSNDKLGLSFLFPAWVGLTALAALRRVSLVRYALMVLVLLGAAMLYSVYVVANRGGLMTEWGADTELAACLGPGIIAAAMLLKRTRKTTEAPVRMRPALVLGGLGLLAGSAAAGFLMYVGQPPPEHRRTILWDEAHSSWEFSAAHLDTEWYGRATTYNYYNFRDFLARRYAVILSSAKLTDARLSAADLLILKTPTAPFADDEVDAIVRFVSRGGSLWMIGDHTDAFGMTSYLNQIGSRLGRTFGVDACMERGSSRNIFARGLFTPSSPSDVGQFLFYTGCSIRAQPLDQDTVMVERMLRDGPDYSAGTFFGDLKPTLNEGTGYAILATQFQFGKGRVAMWADSTLWSNFVVYTPGKPEMSEAVITWLLAEGPVAGQRVYFGLIALVLGFASIFGFRSGLPQVGWLVGAIGTALVLRSSGPGFRYPPENPPMPQVAYVYDQQTPVLPVLYCIDAVQPMAYLTAYIGAQRVGSRPVGIDRLADFKPFSRLVVLPGGAEFDDTFVKRLRNFVEQGGHLFLPDLGYLNAPTMQRLSDAFGLGAEQIPPDPSAKPNDQLAFGALGQELPSLVAATGNPIGRFQCRFCFRHGRALAFEERKRRPMMVALDVGRGKLVVSGTLSLFSDQGLGYCQDVPTRPQLNASQLFYFAIS